MAFKRDRGYLVRLVLLLAIALAGGVYVADHLTSDRTKGWVSEALFGAALEAATRDGGAPGADAGEPE
jgi:hypothetical protein